MFEPDKIQQRALKTWYPKNHELHLGIMHPVLALTGEAGELANLLKKHVYKNGFCAHPDDFLDELGDCLYYLAILAYQHDVTIDELSQMNREKLQGGKHGWPENNESENTES